MKSAIVTLANVREIERAVALLYEAESLKLYEELAYRRLIDHAVQSESRRLVDGPGVAVLTRTYAMWDPTREALIAANKIQVIVAGEIRIPLLERGRDG